MSQRETETPGEQLYRTLRVVTDARFHGSRRLQRHQSFSLWVISLSSILLIVLPLFGPFNIQLNITEGWLCIAQVTAAILILVVSILVNGSNFGTRAEEMHRCGRELNALRREVYLLITETENAEKLRMAQHNYDEILSRYENHSQLDYRWAQISKASDYYNIRGWHRFITGLRTLIEYSLYLILVATLLVFVIHIVA